MNHLKLFDLHNIYLDQSCFLVGAGPSLKSIDTSVFNKRGVVTLAINNVAAFNIRPTFWICGDSPVRFCDNIFKDPGIIKFVPEHALDTAVIEDTPEGTAERGLRVKHCPAVFSYPLTSGFRFQEWLHERSCTWGNSEGAPGDDGIPGCRSTMLAAVKALYVLGFRKIYLVGVDFKMEKGKDNYAFPQDRADQAINNNNRTYQALNLRFDMMKEFFKEVGLQIFNCTPNSNLLSFPFLTLEEGLNQAVANLPTDPVTLGRYDGFIPKKVYTPPSSRNFRQAKRPHQYQMNVQVNPGRLSPPQTKAKVRPGFVKAKTFSK